jgi:hypothetical protein
MGSDAFSRGSAPRARITSPVEGESLDVALRMGDSDPAVVAEPYIETGQEPFSSVSAQPDLRYARISVTARGEIPGPTRRTQPAGHRRARQEHPGPAGRPAWLPGRQIDELADGRVSV